MGKVEKLVVLTVLFLTAIVIAVTLRKGDDKAKTGTDPLNSAEKALLQQPAPGAGAQQPAGLLSSNLQPNLQSGNAGAQPSEPRLDAGAAPALVSGPAVVGTPAPASVGLVKNASGLRPGITADVMVYDWKSGDTWSSVAKTIYGDARYETQLRATNADVKQPKAGEPILVPTVELPGYAAPKLDAPKAVAPTAEKAPTEPTAVAATGGGRTHTVKAGDSLSSIAKQYYGSASKWKTIADANKTTLKDPNKLKLGMKLSIP
ncbi:MAG: LysM peptidoglycan-binding domain-containing protein [Planctomycetes bacterium]|nr:LysM peptidoglycan-binding domain-containing protein [Planctomycetota bacterium]